LISADALGDESENAAPEIGAAWEPRALIAIATTADNTARKSRLFINSLDLTFLHTRSIFLNFELPPPSE
jgi:hypothetical protein